MPTDLTDLDFHSTLLGADRAVVDFHASRTGACIVFKPLFKRVAADYPHVQFFVADTHDTPAVCGELDLGVMPFVAAFRRGALVASLSEADEGQLRAFVEATFGAR